MPAYKDDKRKTWYFSTYYTDGQGRRKKALRRGFKRKSDAQAAERKFLDESERIQAGDVYLKEVLDHMHKFKESPRSTVVSDVSYYNKHYAKYFDTKLLKQYTVDDVLNFKEYLKSTNLKESTCRTIMSVLAAIFEHGVRHFNLPTNPARQVKPFRKGKPKGYYAKFDYLYERIPQIEGEVYRELTVFLMNTGLRIGEARALTWQDVDFINRKLTIDKKLTQFSDEVEYFTKTESSSAAVPFPQIVYDLLVDIRNDQYKYHKYFKESYYVFGGMAPVSYHNYRYAFKRVFKDYTMHDLRHAYASHLNNKGVDYGTLKRLMRHSSISTTIDTYTRSYDESVSQAMENLDKYN